jgi:hypothetical protein
MEPLRGGAFGRMATELTDQLKAVHPDDSTARWAFRWVGSYPNVLTTLSRFVSPIRWRASSAC